MLNVNMCSGDSANVVPPTKNITHPSHQHISGDRRGQPSQNAMERLQSRPTAALIAVQPVPGKYDWDRCHPR